MSCYPLSLVNLTAPPYHVQLHKHTYDDYNIGAGNDTNHNGTAEDYYSTPGNHNFTNHISRTCNRNYAGQYRGIEYFRGNQLDRRA